MNANKLRMPLDILMTILSIILMGGTILFPDDRIHQIMGMANGTGMIYYKSMFRPMRR